MLTCVNAENLTARYADAPDSLSADDREQLELHVEVCGACTAALEDQRHVARILIARPPMPVPPGFSARVAARIDAEPGGWLALLNWRAWTVALTPLAAALVFVAWLGGTWGTTTAPVAATTQASVTPPVTFDTWAASTAGSNRASLFLQPATTGDALLEAVLTGTQSANGDSHDVR